MINATIVALGAALRAKRVSSVELTRALLERVAALDPSLNAFISVDPERALADAKAADAALAAGTAGPLAGIAIAHKDILATARMRTTCGSRMLANYTSPFDAHVVERLARAGTVLVGKTNMDEFAMGSSSETSYFGPVRNPWRPDRVPGGSSGGTAAAVAARHGAGRHGDRHRRLDPPAGRHVRRLRPEAHLRRVLPLRTGRVRVEPRSGRSFRAHRARPRAAC